MMSAVVRALIKPRKEIWATAMSAVVSTVAPAASPVRCWVSRLLRECPSSP